jgi:hypothetical protein
VPRQISAGGTVLPRLDAAAASSGPVDWYPGPRGLLHVRLAAASVLQAQTVTVTLP